MKEKEMMSYLDSCFAVIDLPIHSQSITDICKELKERYAKLECNDV